MDNTVRSIIELDKQSKNKVSELVREKNELSTFIQDLNDSLTKKYADETKIILDDLDESLKTNYIRKEKMTEERSRIKEAAIISHFNLHKKDWLKELFNVCVGE